MHPTVQKSASKEQFEPVIKRSPSGFRGLIQRKRVWGETHESQFHSYVLYHSSVLHTNLVVLPVSPFFSAQPQSDQSSVFQSELWGFSDSTYSSDELYEVGFRADQRRWWQCGWVGWEVHVAWRRQKPMQANGCIGMVVTVRRNTSCCTEYIHFHTAWWRFVFFPCLRGFSFNSGSLRECDYCVTATLLSLILVFGIEAWCYASCRGWFGIHELSPHYSICSDIPVIKSFSSCQWKWHCILRLGQ